MSDTSDVGQSESSASGKRAGARPRDGTRPRDGGAAELGALLVEMARLQGALEERQRANRDRLAAQEARLTRYEATAARRVAELEAANDELRETLLLANNVLGEIKAVCERHGWEEANGVAALAWLEHVLSLGTTAGWPSLN